MPSGSARVCTTAMVCGWQSASTRNTSPPSALTRWQSVIASAAAVPSSSSDALAISMPVRSLTIVWKLRSASSRPCEISGWYGVYAVYHAGFSSTLRRITGGVIVFGVPHADERREHRVAVGKCAEQAECGSLVDRIRERERLAIADGHRHGTVDELVERRAPERAQHRLLLVRIGADVAADEAVALLQRCEARCRLAHLRLPHATAPQATAVASAPPLSRYLRASPARLLAQPDRLSPSVRREWSSRLLSSVASPGRSWRLRGSGEWLLLRRSGTFLVGSTSPSGNGVWKPRPAGPWVRQAARSLPSFVPPCFGGPRRRPGPMAQMAGRLAGGLVWVGTETRTGPGPGRNKCKTPPPGSPPPRPGRPPPPSGRRSRSAPCMFASNPRALPFSQIRVFFFPGLYKCPPHWGPLSFAPGGSTALSRERTVRRPARRCGQPSSPCGRLVRFPRAAAASQLA